ACDWRLFFLQAEDGIRDFHVTGVQTCALPISLRLIAVAVFFLVFALITSPILELSGLRPRTGVRLSELTAWGFGSGLRILLIAADRKSVVEGASTASGRRPPASETARRCSANR